MNHTEAIIVVIANVGQISFILWTNVFHQEPNSLYEYAITNPDIMKKIWVETPADEANKTMSQSGLPIRNSITGKT